MALSMMISEWSRFLEEVQPRIWIVMNGNNPDGETRELFL
jgi:hypothetical protein